MCLIIYFIIIDVNKKNPVKFIWMLIWTIFIEEGICFMTMGIDSLSDLSSSA